MNVLTFVFPESLFLAENESHAFVRKLALYIGIWQTIFELCPYTTQSNVEDFE